MVQWFSRVNLTLKWSSEHAKQRGTSEHFRDFGFIKPTSPLVVVYHFNHVWSMDFPCCLMGQHAALKKFQLSSQLAEILDLVFSLDGGWITPEVSKTRHQYWTNGYNQWLDLPVEYTNSQKNRDDVGLRPIFFLTSKLQMVCLLQKIKMHNPYLTYNHIIEDSLL